VVPTQPLRQPHHQQRHMTVLHFDYHDIFMYVHMYVYVKVRFNWWREW
jgi:hypothetical protein